MRRHSSRRSPSTGAGSPRSCRTRLRLEQLEDRLAPANIVITNAFVVDSNDQPLTPSKGESFYVEADFTTDNLPASASYRVAFSVDGVTLQSSFVTWGAGLATGDWALYWGYWFAAPGNHTVTVTVDPDQSVAETTYADNTTTFSFSPQTAPDLPQKFITPLGGRAQQDWGIVNYVDVNPLPNSISDYQGGDYTYDGHTGHDMTLANFGAMDAGVPVYAAATGTVAAVVDGNDDRNINPPVTAQADYVDIDLGNGWHTIYYHFRRDSILVHVGDHVVQGQILGLAGSSGDSTLAHLHFEVQHNGDVVEEEYDPTTYWVNPLPYQGNVRAVVDSGITSSATLANNDLTQEERPVEADNFVQSAGATLTFWFQVFTSKGDTLSYQFSEPDGSHYSAFDNSYAAGESRGGYWYWTDTLPQNAPLGVWHVAIDINGIQYADDSFTVSANGAPAMRLKQGSNSYEVPDGRTTPLDFGTVAQDAADPQMSFSIQNLGSAALVVSNLAVPAGFALVGSFPSSVPVGGAPTFTLQMTTTAALNYAGIVSMTTNDPHAPTFAFAIKGSISDAHVGAVHGEVYFDGNGDGIADGADLGLSGWTVSLIAAATNKVLATTTTGFNGLYSYLNLTSGTYRVRVNARAGYGQTTADPADVTVAGNDVLAAPVGVATSVATSLVYVQQPSDTATGKAINPAVTIDVLDQFGNRMTTDTSDQVTVAANGPAGFTADSTATVTVSGGVATFSNLVLDTPGSYTLAQSLNGTPVGQNSGSFNVKVSPHLALVVPPSNTIAGQAINPAVQVGIYDQAGNLLTGDNSDQVTLSVASGPGGFAVGSTTTVTASGGIATFTNLVLDIAGSYTLGESATGSVTGPDSAGFTISPAGIDHLVFGVPPSAAAAGVAINPAVQVQVVDLYGNVETADNIDQVTLAVGSGPGGFTANSTTAMTVTSGVALFSNLVLDTAGSYTLGESATGGLTGADSSSFSISPAAADHLTFAAHPGIVLAGVNLGPSIVVNILDRFGNLLTNDSRDRVGLFVGAGPASFAPGSTATMPVNGGSATFPSLVLPRAGTYTLVAGSTVDALAATASVSVLAVPQFTVTLAPATLGATDAGQSFTVTIAAMANGKLDAAYQGNVLLTSSDPQAALAGTGQPLPTKISFVPTEGGKKTVTVILNSLGRQAVSVTDTTLPTARATSNGVTVIGTISLVLDHFIVAGVPAPDVAGAPHTLVITAVNAGGQVIPTFTGTVHVASTDPAFQSVDVSFTAATNGVAHQVITLATPGPQTITVTGGGTSGTLANINVVSPAARLRVSASPTPIAAGNTVNVMVQAVTSAGTPDTLFADTLVLATSDPNAQVIAQPMSGGGQTFQVTFTTAGLQTITVTNVTRPTIRGTSATVRVNPGAVQQLAVTGFPFATIAGVVHSYIVTALDQFGNRVTNFSDRVQVPGQTYAFQPGDYGSHTFQTALGTSGTQALTVTDTRTGMVGSEPNIAVITTAAPTLAPDPLVDGQTALVVIAPALGGTITITPATPDGMSLLVTVKSNGITVAAGTFTPSALGHLYVVGRSGRVVIQEVAATINGQTVPVAVPAILVGGSGMNTLSAAGSSANNILIGGPAADGLSAGTGRDILIGAGGADTLNAGAGGDILIGGATTSNAQLASLAAILTEWGSNDPYPLRVQTLFGNVTGQPNATLLNASALINDGAANQVNSGSGLDWIWLESALDRLMGAAAGDMVTVK